MKKKFTSIILLSCFLIMLTSCESKAEKEQRQARLRIELAQHLEQERIELEEKQQKEAEFQKEVAEFRQQRRVAQEKQDKERLVREEKELAEKRKTREIELEAQLIQEEKDRKAKALRDKYINNSLYTGATPYAYCFGSNKSCSDYGCSEIRVKTPHSSDVMVTIKKDGVVYSHAYIKAGGQYTFELRNGTYQPFFYYGKGWNPNKEMKETDCGMLRGGFVADEHFGKDLQQTLSNEVLTYELILQKSGNFSTKPSNADEAF